MKNVKRAVSIFICVLLIGICMIGLTGCGKKMIIMLWGPGDHEELYLKWAEQFRELHLDELKGVEFAYSGSGDAGAYAAMQVDPAAGAAVYTFPNDQMANLVNLGALSPVTEANLEWSKTNNSPASVSATFIGETAYAYPLQADNGYYMYFNKAAFRDTAVWDAERDTLKEGYTFRDLYAALDEKGDDETGNWSKGLVTYAMGDSWYLSGVFFAVGGDYEVKYNSEGKQESAKCWFGCTMPEGSTSYLQDGDFTIGLNAIACMKNAICNEDGTVNPHYMYTDGDKSPLNDKISVYANPVEELCKETPLAAAVCGTWKAKEIQGYWGDNYAATVLPVLEGNDGLYPMKNFCGHKFIGVNPQCDFAKESRENLLLLHELAHFMSSKETQLERYNKTGAGPSNIEALNDPLILKDAALLALNAQYDRVCVYPEGTPLAGQPIGNGLGYRIQDSVPANYWTPIQKFGNNLYNELSTGELKMFANEQNIMRALAQLQMDIEAVGQ